MHDWNLPHLLKALIVLTIAGMISLALLAGVAVVGLVWFFIQHV